MSRKRSSGALWAAILASSLLTGVALAKPAVINNGPFGISMGEPLADLGKTVPQPELLGVYLVVHPPKPSPALPRVGVMAFPSTGVCRVVGAAAVIEDARGTSARQQADQLAALLEQKYGSPNKTDECDDEDGCRSLWVDDVYDGHARYQYQWNLQDSHRPDGIVTIVVKVMADDALRSYPAVSYYFANNPACEAAVSAANGAAL